MNAPVKLSAVSAAHPFPGLRPFAYQDREFFFGRQDQIYALYRRIDRFRFITVVGSSGSGKSSLVRAGLLPLLDVETREAGGHNWVCCEMRPGDAPLSRLTDLLVSLSVDDDPMVASGRRDRIAAQLRRSSFGISEALAETSSVAGKSLVLVIDQFEELFRYAGSSDKTGLTAEEVRARDEATQFVQLLLESSHSPSIKTHVLLTMRSDFIGDCARFHGLPEAVCEAQFLTPSLTRDQLDEVIRKPIEKAGATIDPQLVERLLNDCGTEMDQLPVLQHCLSRLWEEAGGALTANVKSSEASQFGGEISNIEQPARRISLDHYRKIGQFADALSMHADEILKDLPGPKLQLAVGQIFSALSEFDKGGRATRRALKFSQLVAETGLDDATVRQVLDRFRASDCSFLTPPPFEVKAISGDTRIDVGHEALLRRWDKVSGRGAELGWLRAEQQAGERYRGLLAMAEGNDAVLPAHLFEERWAWWNDRPRTPAWADRYGGGYSRVKGLLLKSRNRMLARRLAMAVLFVAVTGVAVTMYQLWQNADLRRQQALQATEEANLRRREALQATNTSIGRLAGFLNDGTIRAGGAEKFLEDAKVSLDQLAAIDNRSPDLSKIEISLLHGVSDVKDALGDYKQAFDIATNAETLSLKSVKKYPDISDFKQLHYESKFRVGDQLARNEENIEKAEHEYRDAVDLAKELATSEPDNIKRQRQLIFALNKVGDMRQARRDWPGALEQYNEGLRIARSIAVTYPSAVATQKNRIAQVFSARNQPGDKQEALDEYREALKLQEQELFGNPSDATLISNIALTHRRIGDLLRDEKPDEAQREFEAAVEARRRLYQRDPARADWRIGLVTDNTRLGDVLFQNEKNWPSLRNYNEAVQIVEAIILNNPSSTTRWESRLAALNAKRGDVLFKQGEDRLKNPDPPESRLMRNALERYYDAARSYEGLLIKVESPPYGELFEVRKKIGDVLVRRNDYEEALQAYQAASNLAVEAAATQRVVDWQIKLSNAVEQAGDGLRAGDSALIRLANDYYQKALEILDAAAINEPDNHDLQSKRAALEAKIKAQQPMAR
jgi:tetratricopeptide (TPR) repeat protein